MRTSALTEMREIPTVVSFDEYDSLFRDHAPELWRSLFVYTGGSVEVAQEAVAEAFALALERREEIREPLPWLWRVAFRIALADMRRERARATEPLDAIDYSLVLADDIPARAEVIDLLNALLLLSPKQRAVVFLHYRSDLSVKEIASVLAISPATVKVHLHRARRRLRVLLDEKENPDG